MKSNNLKDWTRRQLQLKCAHLNGRIDGLVAYRHNLREELQETVQNISNLEELRRGVDIGQDQDTLEHLRKRELDLRQELRDLGDEIDDLSDELEPIDHELAGRPLLDEEFERHIESRRRESRKEIKRIKNEGQGVFGRLRSWLFGD